MSERVCEVYGVFVLGDENRLVMVGLYDSPFAYDRAYDEARELAMKGDVAFVLQGYRPINQAEPGDE